MYLALIPDAQTTEALRRFAPALPADVHLTVIHSKAQKPPALRLPIWSGLITADALQCEMFGYKHKVRALKLRTNAALQALRREAEHILITAGLKWSQEWAFSPHVTLGPADAVWSGNAPEVLEFDQLVWR